LSCKMQTFSINALGGDVIYSGFHTLTV